MSYPCNHLASAAGREGVTPSSHGCEECLRSGSRWVKLRLCLACGHVGCCDSSPNRHATKHYHATQHPVIRSYEPGEQWAYCYPHEAYLDAMPERPGESAPQHYAAPAAP
jgi:uncharacterized UBP type Zn finger protein